ncbi:hypothetical protein ACNTMW_30885 [Planosporangium sp. 12N6]|uniref:hypothetical protein n=1 Tax=Planosporangium spinosum TaxID=3402278 RepID=UPI003CED1BA1
MLVTVKRNVGVAISVVAFVTGIAGTAQAATSTAAPTPLTNRVSAALERADANQQSGPTIASNGAVTIDTATPAAKVSAAGETVTMTLMGANHRQTQPLGAGRSFGDVARDTDTVVRPTAGGAQIINVLRTQSAPTTQSYRLDLPAGVKLVPTGAGFTLVEENTGKITGMIEAPWAKDATGRDLPTNYQVDGSTLVQHTDVTGATFPVVTDPKLSYGWNIYLNMWGYEARSYAVAISAAGGTAIVVSCSTIGKIPHAALRSLATMACGAVSLNLKTLFLALYRIGTSIDASDSRCFQFNLTDQSGQQGVVVNDNECR